MKKIYKLGGFAVTTLAPLAFIACGATNEKKPEVTDYYNAPTVTQTSATVTFKSLDKFVGKMLAVKVKVSSGTQWSSTQKVGITDANKGALEMTFTLLEKGKDYDMQVLAMEPGTTQIFETLGEKPKAFKTQAAPTATLPVDPNISNPPASGGDNTKDDEDKIPTDKVVTSSVEVTSPTSAEISIKDLGKYNDKNITLKYKQIKDASTLTIDDYFTLTARTTTTATLSFDGDYLDAYKGKKLKVKYKKNGIAAPASGAPSTGVDSEGYKTKVIAIPEDVKTAGLSTTLDTLEASTYDLKLTVVETENEETVAKELGDKASAFVVSAEAVTPTSKEKQEERAVAKTNYQLIKFNLTGLQTKAKYTYSLYADGENADEPVKVLDYSDENSFDTSNTTKVEKVVNQDKVTIKLTNLLNKYVDKNLTFVLRYTSDLGTGRKNEKEERVAHALVENKSASVTFDKLIAGDYVLQVSYADGTQGGKIILQGIDPNDLKLSMSALVTPTITEAVGPSSITLSLANATSYKGLNLIVTYAPKDVQGTLTNEELLKSEYAQQVPETVSETGTVSFSLLNLEKATSDTSKERTYIYKIVTQETNILITTKEYNEVKTTPYASVKINKTTDASGNLINDNTITYAGSSAKVTITDLEAYKGKKLIIHAVPNPSTTPEYLTNYFPTDATAKAAVRKSDPVTVSSTAPFDTEFKIVNLDSEKYYVFQVFVEGETNPLLFKGYDFKANVTPNTAETLTAKDKISVKVSKLGNAVGGKIQLKHGKTLEDVNGTDTSKYTVVTEQDITAANKDSITFEITSIAGTSLAYKLEIKPSGETDFSPAKEVVLPLPKATAIPKVGALTLNLTDGTLIVGKEIYAKYKKSSDTDFTSFATTTNVSADGTATLELTGLESGEEYNFSFWVKGDSEFEILNAADTDKKATTLSKPIAEVKYGTEKTKVDITIAPLYDLVGSTLLLKYREAVGDGEEPKDWTNFATEGLVTEANKVEGIAFNLTGLTDGTKYEFQILEKTSGATIAATASFQHPITPKTP